MTKSIFLFVCLLLISSLFLLHPVSARTKSPYTSHEVNVDANDLITVIAFPSGGHGSGLEATVVFEKQ